VNAGAVSTPTSGEAKRTGDDSSGAQEVHISGRLGDKPEEWTPELVSVVTLRPLIVPFISMAARSNGLALGPGERESCALDVGRVLERLAVFPAAEYP